MSASESSESDEMTAEEQNQRNCENDDIARVLTNFMQSREETLEDLVGGFMYLTMDDVKKSTNPAVMAALRKRENDDADVESGTAGAKAAAAAAADADMCTG
nr:hypothetical protein BaRGS_030252 [Batillaria attramentaria]